MAGLSSPSRYFFLCYVIASQKIGFGWSRKTSKATNNLEVEKNTYPSGYQLPYWLNKFNQIQLFREGCWHEKEEMKKYLDGVLGLPVCLQISCVDTFSCFQAIVWAFSFWDNFEFMASYWKRRNIPWNRYRKNIIKHKYSKKKIESLHSEYHGRTEAANKLCHLHSKTVSCY